MDKFKFLSISIMAICSAYCHNAFAQKNDYTWLQGAGSFAHTTNTIDSFYGNMKLNFNYSPVQIGFDSIGMNFMESDISFSDSNGNLLFYSNGVYIANADGETIENGDSINFGDVNYQWGTIFDGEDLPQSMIVLPSVTNSNQYYLVHSFCDTAPGNPGENYTTKILTTLLDMNSNSGLGKAIYKNQAIINTGIFGNALTATKHGNGRDWWIIIQKQTSNCFYSLLYDTNGFQIVDSVCVGAMVPQYGGQDRVCFSPDGSKFVYLGYYTGVSLFDFDRCTGRLSNFKSLPLIPSAIDSGDGAGLGLSISPSNRLLYISSAFQLYQFDLWSDNIWGSIDTIGIDDRWHPFQPSDVNAFGTSQVAPDGKIYMCAGADLPAYNVINNPDELGAACNFTQHSVNLHTLQYGIPNYPNYRLGALSQSQCDTLAGLNDVQRAAKEQILKVYPNPAADYAIVDYGFTDWSKGGVYLELCNTLGQTVYTQPLPMYSGLQKIDVSTFASGMYMVFIKRDNGMVATGKLVKQ